MKSPFQTRLSFSLMPIFALIAPGIIRADDGLPKRAEFGRYDPMLKQSLFAVATAVVVPAATPNFAKDLYVANAARSPEGDMVTVASTSDQNFKKYLTTKAPVDGYSIANIEWSERVGATKVTISKDGQFATLNFNEAVLSQRANAPPRNVPQSVPNVPPPAPDFSGRARTPHARDVIRRSPRTVPAVNPNHVAVPEPPAPAPAPAMPERPRPQEQ
jgi:hypothetical protein